MANQKEKLTWQEYLEKTAEKDQISLQECFDKLVKNISSCRIATHVGKFSNPDAKQIAMVGYESNMTNLGYVTTQNTSCRADIFAGAQYSKTAEFLLYEFDETRNIMQAVVECPDALQKELEKLSLPFDELKQAVSQLIEISMHHPDRTNKLLKQVYFPVGEDRYHLLSIMPASSLLIELRRRIRNINGQKISCYTKTSPNYGQPCEEITQLTIMGFGGTKPVNISKLNSKINGKAYLLRSMPPVSQRRRKLPKRNYFNEMLVPNVKMEQFDLLSKYLSLEKNNMEIRQKTDGVIDDLIGYVLEGVYELRTNSPHWTEVDAFRYLNFSQKIWLDDGLKEQRKSPEWSLAIGHMFAEWVANSYNSLIKDGKPFSDTEFKYVKGKMVDVLREEVRYSL